LPTFGVDKNMLSSCMFWSFFQLPGTYWNHHSVSGQRKTPQLHSSLSPLFPKPVTSSEFSQNIFYPSFPKIMKHKKIWSKFKNQKTLPGQNIRNECS
jgi:hypothetical protein